MYDGAWICGDEPRAQRQLAAQGGRAAHARGTAYRWTEAAAKAAGRKGGLARHANARAAAHAEKPAP